MLNAEVIDHFLPIDKAAAKAHVVIAASRRATIHGSRLPDRQGTAVATRNVRDFGSSDILIIDPFHASRA